MKPQSSFRKVSLWAGILYLLTFVSVPTLSLFAPIHELNYLSSPATDHQVVVGVLLELIVALSGIGTAVVLFTVLKNVSLVAALSLVGIRVLEAATIFIGTAVLLTALYIYKSGIDANGIAHTLVILYDRIFIAGQSLLPAIDDLLLGYLFYRSALIPKWLSLLGIIGAFPLLAGNIALQFGIIDRASIWSGISAIGVAGFELLTGLYLTVKGFKSYPIENKNHPVK